MLLHTIFVHIDLEAIQKNYQFYLFLFSLLVLGMGLCRRDVIRSEEQYGSHASMEGPLLFGKVKIWGEVVEHETGYRSEFAKIVSLDYGDANLLEKFRKIYRVNQVFTWSRE